MIQKFFKFFSKHKIIIFAFTFAVFLKIFVFQIYVVNGVSMYPTLKNGDIVVLEKLSTYFNQPNYSDIVVLDNNGKLIIKRIVAKGNDNIEFKNRSMYINNIKKFDNINGPVDLKTTILKDYYYVMGDNRDLSVDSRQFGAIYKKNIVGKYLFKI